MTPLHVTNGESTAGTLRASSLDGDVLSWDDALHAGPLADDPSESRRLRAAFLAQHGWGEAAAIERELEHRDRRLAAAQRVALWFEHDLFDQLQLIQILSQLDPNGRVELVQADDYLGALSAIELEALWPTRSRLDAATIELAREAWRAVTDDDIEAFLERDTSALPHLRAALLRLLEERAPVPRTKRQLLSALRDGPRTPLELFHANQEMEDAVFLGDSWCFLYLYELAQEGRVVPTEAEAMPLPPPRGDHDTFVATRLALVA